MPCPQRWIKVHVLQSYRTSVRQMARTSQVLQHSVSKSQVLQLVALYKYRVQYWQSFFNIAISYDCTIRISVVPKLAYFGSLARAAAATAALTSQSRAATAASRACPGSMPPSSERTSPCQKFSSKAQHLCSLVAHKAKVRRATLKRRRVAATDGAHHSIDKMAVCSRAPLQTFRRV